MTTLSHDGQSRWNGYGWVPAGPAPTFYHQPTAQRRVPTGWTKPMQYSVVAWYLIQAIWSVTTPFLLAGPLTDYLNQTMQRSAQLNPSATPPPIEFISGLITWSLAIGAAIGVAIAAVAIIGTRRWRWVFYAVLVLLGLQVLSFPFALVGAFTTSASTSLKMPVGITAGSVTLGVPAVALFVWMLVAVIRRGPWAMTRG